MAFSDSVARTTPNNWIIQTNDGTTVVAINTVTKETYNGTLSGFNTLLKQSKPSFDVANANPVVLIDPTTGQPYSASSATTDHEFVVTTYRVKTAFTNASIGDTVTATQVIDVSTATPSTITTIWRNQTTAADLASAPSAANLELVGSNALTDAQLRASAVSISGTVTATGPLTDTQLRASAVPVSLNNDREVISVGYVVNTAFTGASVGNIVSATHVYDISSGTPTLVSSIWRNETLNTTLASAPTIANLTINLSLTNSELRATAVPVSGPLTDTQLRATRINVEPLGIPGVSRQLAASVASANTVLTTTVARISIFARNANIRYTVGSSSQTASSTSHYIAQNERLDIDVPSTPNIAVIRADSIDGILEVTELS